MKEIWKDIKNYEGLYQISNLGRIRSLNYRRTKIIKIMKPSIDNCGYLRINLSKNGIECKKKVHRLVAETFISNPYNLLEVNHKNEIKSDNRVDNLEWCCHKYNCNYGTIKERKSNYKVKPVLCIELNTIFKSTMEAFKKTNVHSCSISNCCSGRQKTAGGYHWRYINE